MYVQPRPSAIFETGPYTLRFTPAQSITHAPGANASACVSI